MRTVSIVAVPEASLSTVTGLYDVLSAFKFVGGPGPVPFNVEIAGERRGALELPSGLPILVQRGIDEIEATDVVIVPSLVVRSGQWEKRRYPKLVAWLAAMHARGAVLCSACSGMFLLGETGLFDGKAATVHYVYQRQLAHAYPAVELHPERALVIAGRREELVSSGASTSWHDLVLYLYARYGGATAAQTVARFFALQWHQEGLAPYIVFEGRTDHGDADIRAAQTWLASHFAVARPVEAAAYRKRFRAPDFTRAR
jgi:transcriptional regulator GlxA family with amidase domain